jgi:hypothetical protein
MFAFPKTLQIFRKWHSLTTSFKLRNDEIEWVTSSGEPEVEEGIPPVVSRRRFHQKYDLTIIFGMTSSNWH